jgi:hypothetical protein
MPLPFSFKSQKEMHWGRQQPCNAEIAIALVPFPNSATVLLSGSAGVLGEAKNGELGVRW